MEMMRFKEFANTGMFFAETQYSEQQGNVEKILRAGLKGLQMICLEVLLICMKQVELL